METFPLESKVVHDDGSVDYTYQVNGHRVVEPLPPPGLDFAKATTEQRAHYGVPQPPPVTDAYAYKQWEALMSRLYFVAPSDHLVSTNVSATITNSHWSGWMDTNDPSHGNYREALGEYTEPYPHGGCGSGAAAVFWSGLGGFSAGSTLGQDGTALSTPGLADHQAWTQVYPEQRTVQPVDLYATESQYFKAQVDRIHPQGSPVGEFQFSLTNVATGAHKTRDYFTSNYDGSTAEYIAERPERVPDGGFYPLLNFGPFHEDGAKTDGQVVQFWPHTRINMFNGGTQLAATSAIVEPDYGEFNIDWQHCL